MSWDLVVASISAVPALIETIGSMTLAAFALVGGLSLVYASFAHLWLKHSAYETSICLSTSAPTMTCRQELVTSTDRALPIGRLENVRVVRSHSRVQTNFQWRFTNQLVLSIEDVRHLPLLGSESGLSLPRLTKGP